MMRRVVLTALLGVVCVAVLRCAEINPRLSGTPLLRVWQAEDYGASPLNTRLLIHPEGLIYVANDDGVLEYDGDRWRLLELPGKGAGRALALDSTGRLWVFGHDDAAYFERTAIGELKAISVIEKLPPEARATGTINRVAVTSDGIYARGQRRLMLFKPDGTVQTWPGASLSGLVWTVGDTLYADLDRLVRVSPAGVEPVAFGPEKNTLADGMRVFATQRGGERGALLLTQRGPMLWEGPGTPMRPLSPEAAAAFGEDQASAGAFLADGRLALGTERSGLMIFTREGHLSQRLDRTHGLPGNRINDLALDGSGGLWAAMQEGLARIEIDGPFALHGGPQGLGSHARRFASWRGQLYLSTAEGVSRRDAASGRFHAIAGFQVGTNRPLVVGERLVAATRGLREILADDSSRPWTSELIGPITAAAREPGWIFAGSSSGLWLIKPAKGGWETAGRVTAASAGMDELLDRGDGWLWGITRGGEITRTDFRNGARLDAPVMVFGPADGVPEAGRNDHVQLVTVGEDVLAVAAEWIRRFEPGSGRFVPEPRLSLDGAPVRGARLAGRSAKGGAWLRPIDHPARLLLVEQGDDGGWRITSRSIAPFRAVAFDSLYEETATNTLWLAGQGVLASLDLGWQPARPPAQPRLTIRRVESETGTLLAAGLAENNRLNLPAEQNALRISFAAAHFSGDYRGRPQTLYRTRLEGLDREWSAWSSETHRDFTNLPYRPLRFQAQARVPGRADSTEASLELTVDKPWWLTSWAVLGYAGILASATYGVLRLRTHQLQERNARLEAIVAARTRQLEHLNQELTDAVRIVAHDLRGPVAGIRSLARQLRATPHLWTSAEGPEFMGEIERTSESTVEMMARLLDLQRASDRVAGLAFVPVEISPLIAEVCRQLEPAAAAKRIALQVDARPVTHLSDAEALSSIVSNLVSNAIKFTPADGRGLIRITLKRQGDELILSIADNGPGVREEDRARIFEKFTRGTAKPTAGEAATGLGLHIANKLVAALQGRIDIVDTPGGGATFVVTLPLLFDPAPGRA